MESRHWKKTSFKKAFGFAFLRPTLFPKSSELTSQAVQEMFIFGPKRAVPRLIKVTS